MDNVKILIHGYARKPPGGRWDATSTCTLVKSCGKKILIDPGMFPDKLKASLEKERLLPEDIDIIVNSHSHPDHTRNSRLFAKEKVFDIFKRYKQIPEDMTVPGTKVKVIFTPGHTEKHVAFLVETPEGRCGIAGVAIWWKDDEEQETDYRSLIEHNDPVAKDQLLIQESREKLFNLADYIIPGHGKMFRVPKQ